MYEANLLSISWTKREWESSRISKSSVVTSQFRVAGFPNPQIPQYCEFHGKLEHISLLSECLNIISAEATFNICPCYTSGSGCSVGIATDYELDGPGIESQWGRDFPPVQTGPGAHPASCKMGTGFFPGVKCGQSVVLTTHPLLVPRSWKNRAIPLPTLWATPGL